MANKKLLFIIGAVLILLVGGLIFYSSVHQPPAQVGESPKPFDPQNPPWITGLVLSASSDQIAFTSNSSNYTATISSETKLVKQVIDPSTGIVTVVQANISDFAPSNMIAVYFSQPPAGSTYQADKIQIISQ